MKANELRINNYVLARGAQAQIKAVDETHASYVKKHLIGEDRIPLKFIKPIPLTEKWLVKFGFEVTKGKFFDEIYGILNKKDVVFEYWLDGDMYINGMTEESLLIPKEINYVHELQNLYFAHTGEELKTQDNE